MSSHAVLSNIAEQSADLAPVHPAPRKSRAAAPPTPFRIPAFRYDDDGAVQRQAELFYLQKQIQTQTPMVIVLEDGEQIEGYIEWYDRHTLKVRGRSRMLIFKSAIKYMYKQGEMGASGV